MAVFQRDSSPYGLRMTGLIMRFPIGVGNDKEGTFVIPATFYFVIPAKAGISLYCRFYGVPGQAGNDETVYGIPDRGRGLV